MPADIQKINSDNPIKNGTATTKSGNSFNSLISKQPVKRAVFNASGTWTCPANVTEVEVECWGGGGAGSLRSGINSGAGGGGGGAYVRSRLTVVPGQAYTVTVGGAANDSWFGGVSIILAKGGVNASTNSVTGAAGGSADASVGEVKISGGNGGDADTKKSGYGGISPNGGLGGDGVYASGSNAVGLIGNTPGGGGSGAWKGAGGGPAGGAGAVGRVIVSYVEVPKEVYQPEIGDIEDKYTERFDDTGYYA